MLNFIKRYRVLSLVLFLNVVAVLIAILVIIIYQSKTATVDIMVTPSAAVIELNGKKYDNLATHDVRPGEYHVRISMEGMQAKEYDLNLADNGFARIWDYLLDADGGFSYYVSHPEDAMLLEDVADAEAREFLQEFAERQSIRDVLPLTFANTYDENATEVVSISIDFGVGEECEEKPYCLVIYDYTGKNSEKAIGMIREAGYNPDDYELVFKEGEE